MTTEGRRLPGLDLMRTLAILLVLWEHIRFLAQATWPSHSFFLPVDGVDVFFVLSGFLVGGLWLDTASHYPLRQALKRFWWRRLWRIWPLYYLFLLLNLAGVALGWQPGQLSEGVVWYFFFAQNVVKPVDLFFWESWSLCVEELFYFLLPLVYIFLIICLSHWQPRQALLTSALILVAIGWLYRWLLPDQLPYDLWYRKMAPGRLDALGWGVCVAACQDKLSLQGRMWRKGAWLAIGLIGWTVAGAAGFYPWPSHLSWVAAGVAPLGLAASLPFFRNLSTLPIGLAKVVERMARWSYAAYLFHMGWVVAPLRRLMPSPLNPWEAVGIICGYFFMVFGGAALLHHCVERPALRIRESWPPAVHKNPYGTIR
ncbi:MAG: acyltransferase [Flavobacteriales bacterium]|nr:acyltransferase [Flavobacteriales bacterium]MDW8409707.1 acyltransferase [Flavobacteriales bacterium]